MSKWLVDTNIVSEAIKPVPNPRVMAWLNQQRNYDLFISAITLSEIVAGIALCPSAKRKAELEAWMRDWDGPLGLFAGRILPFDHRAALDFGQLIAQGRSDGRTLPAIDTMIAAIAQVHRCRIVTMNVADFPYSNPYCP